MQDIKSSTKTVTTEDGEVVEVEMLGTDSEGRFDANLMRHQIEAAGELKSETEAAAKLLQRTTPAVLAQMTNTVRQGNPKMSRREAEDIARGSPQFLEHLTKTIEAERVANLAAVRFRARIAFADALRTQQADRRAERRGY